MKTIKTIRRTVAMMLIFFAIMATSCQKESEFTPDNNSDIPANTAVVPPPVIPPPAPTVSFKPKSILTTINGAVKIQEFYKYDIQNRLTSYVFKESNQTDSMILSPGKVEIFTNGGVYKETLTLNTDKTYKHIRLDGDDIHDREFDFLNSQDKLSRMVIPRAGTTPQTIMVANYQSSPNIAEIQFEQFKLDISYYDNLPYQKGVNGIGIDFSSIRYFKVMEQENATSMFLYNKLIKNVTHVFGADRVIETEDFTYQFDALNRVSVVTEKQVFNPGATNMSQRILIHTYTY